MANRNIILLILFLFSMTAKASSFYVDVGGGVSQYMNASVFAGASVPATSNLGVSGNLGFFTSFGDGALEFHVGVQERFSMITQGALTFGVHSPLAMVRIQFARIFISAGYTPFVWSRLGTNFGFDNFTSITNGNSYLAEVGFLFPVTPKFSLGLVSTGQYINNSGTISPSPAIDIGAFMRFHFGFFGGSESSSRATSNEYQGWRYPFGRI